MLVVGWIGFGSSGMRCGTELVVCAGRRFSHRTVVPGLPIPYILNAFLLFVLFLSSRLVGTLRTALFLYEWMNGLFYVL